MGSKPGVAETGDFSQLRPEDQMISRAHQLVDNFRFPTEVKEEPDDEDKISDKTFAVPAPQTFAKDRPSNSTQPHAHDVASRPAGQVN